jgi:Zinc knuckle
LDPELERKVTEALISTDDPHFLLVWMTMVEKIRKLSVNHLKNLQKRVENQMPTDYAGQNLDAMAEANIRDLLDLLQGGWYSTSTGYQMARNFTSANSECGEFKQFAYDILARYKAAIEKCFHMGDKESAAYMDKEGLGFEQVCVLFGDYYRTANQDGHWLPTKNVRDNHGAPTNFANTAKTRRALNVVPNTSQTSTGACHNCGQPGHWAKNCLTKKLHPKLPTKPQATAWTRAPPPPGSPQTKMMHNKKFHWCARCNRWTTSHGTDQHRSKPESGSSESSKPTKVVHLTSTDSFTAWNCMAVTEPAAQKAPPSFVASSVGLLWSLLLYPTLVSGLLTLGISPLCLGLSCFSTFLDMVPLLQSVGW